MSPSSTPVRALPHPVLFAFRAVTGVHASLVLLTESPVAELAGLEADRQVQVITRSHLLREPACSTGRAIWAQSRLTPDVGDRYRAIERITANPDGVTLGDLLGVIRSDRLDPVHQILHFVAAGHLAMSLDDGIHPGSLLKPGPKLIAGIGLFGLSADYSPEVDIPVREISNEAQSSEVHIRWPRSAQLLWGTEGLRRSGRVSVISALVKPPR
jgi:hypothetical protein